MKHWHGGENSLFKIFPGFLTTSCWWKIQVPSATNRSQRLIMIGEDHLHIIEEGAV